MKIISAAYHIHFHPACSSVTLVPPPDQAPSELQGLALCPWGRSDGPRLRTARQHPSPCPTQWSAGLGELGLSGGNSLPRLAGSSDGIQVHCGAHPQQMETLRPLGL